MRFLVAAGSSYLPSVERSASPYDSSVRGPRKFLICGESGGSRRLMTWASFFATGLPNASAMCCFARNSCRIKLFKLLLKKWLVYCNCLWIYILVDTMRYCPCRARKCGVPEKACFLGCF